MDLQSLMKKLAAGAWDVRLALVYGEEPLGVEEASSAILGAIESRGATRIACGPKDTDAALLEDALSQMSLFAERRVLFVDGVSQRAEGLGDLVERIGGSEDLFLLVRHFGDVDKRLRWYKRFQSDGAVFRFDAVKERDMPARIRERASLSGLDLSADAADAIAGRVGTDLLTARNEIEKLRLYASPRTRLTLEDVEAVVGRSRDTLLYEITEGLAGRDRERSLADLRDLLRQGVTAGAILSMLAREVRYLLQAKIALREDRSLGGALRSYASFAGYLRDKVPTERKERFGKGKGNLFLQHPYVTYLRLGQASRFEEAELAGLLAAFSRADRAVKSGAGSAETVLFAVIASASGRKH
ncbi:MAG: DNA polymerase III subunit delta [Candidatus Latescibacterota bacterium]|nr:MAG: DNA polymerase III subunit delta [Candidatus Latescibacterota bacterium]